MSNTHAISLKRTSALLAALAFTAALLVVNLSIFSAQADAAQLANRSLTLSSTLDGTHTDGSAGDPTNGSAASHSFSFDTTGGATSATFTYCTNAIGTCTTPTGLVIPGAPVASSGSASALGGVITWTDTIPAASTVTVSFDGITNPTYIASPTNQDDNTFFVRIVTDGGDEGTVASAITEGIVITARVAETLGFSTAAYDGTNPWISETASSTCDALEGSGAITLGDPTDGTLSISTTYDAYSGFRLYTNAASGVSVQYEGTTLTKGLDTIAAVGGTAVGNSTGSEQFGLAVDLTVDGANTDLTDASTDDPGTAGRLDIGDEYDGGNDTFGTGAWAFDDSTGLPVELASSNGYVSCDTYAVQYIGNIAPTTAAGTYTTTIVYSAVPTY